MARVNLVAVALLGLAIIAQANATAVGSCWFSPESEVSGILTLEQATSADPVTIYGTLTSKELIPLYFHLQTYGDLYNGVNRGACVVDSAFSATPDVLENYVFSTSTSSITLFGSSSIIGRSFGVYQNVSSCAEAVLGTAVAQCVIGIHNTTGNEAVQTLSVIPKSAVAAIHLANGTITGWATFAPNLLNTSEVIVHINVWGLVANSIHAVHVHWYGAMTDTAGLAMGGHLNPYGYVHGAAPNPYRHMGDIGNFTANDEGVIDAVGSYNLLNFNGTGNIIGRGLIFHAVRDDGNPTGDATSVGTAGARYGRGVIGISSRRPTAVNPAHAQCWFAPVSGVSGTLNFQQFTATGPLYVSGTLSTGSSASTYSLHVTEYGDLVPGNGGSCFGTSDRALQTITSGVAFNGYSLDYHIWGEGGIIGRMIGVYSGSDSCSGSVSLTPIGQCVVGISNVGALTNRAVQTLSSSPVSTHCQIAPGSAAPTTLRGEVMFAPATDDEVYVYAFIQGLTPYKVHSIHVHWYGDMSTSDGLSMGGHLNPYNLYHGIAPSTNRHMGDIGNLTADANGVIQYGGYYNLLNFNGTGNVIGRGVVFHAQRDDGNPTNSSTSTGDAGARWGRCVVGISGRTPLYPPFIVPSTSMPPGPPTSSSTGMASSSGTDDVGAASVSAPAPVAVIVTLLAAVIAALL